MRVYEARPNGLKSSGVFNYVVTYDGEIQVNFGWAEGDFLLTVNLTQDDITELDHLLEAKTRLDS